MGTRVTLALVGVSIFALLAVGLLFYGFIGRYVVEREEERMLSHAVKVAGQVENLATGSPGLAGVEAGRALQMLLYVDLQVLPAGAAIMVFRNDLPVAMAGPATAKLEDYQELYEPAVILAAHGAASRVVDVPQLDATLVLAAVPFTFEWDRGLVVMTLPISDAVASRRGLVGVLLVSGAVAVALAVALGLGLGSRMARPLRRLSRVANAMSQGSYEEPVTGAYPGEVYELATSLETMRREVKRSEESLRGFVASAAHELRTPLTSITGFSQALLDGTAASDEERQRSAAAIHRESTRLRRLVDTLLMLSRYDSGDFHSHTASVDIGRLVAEEIELLVDTGATEHDRILLTVDGEVAAATDGIMLRQAVANLLRNAVQYGGSDPITVGVERVAGQVRISVANGGAPISLDERAHVFSRFYRGRSSGGMEGFGLGLPLVKEICTALGGTVEIVDHPERTVFVVTVPVSRA
ncbi:MAG: HAMP domain-containing histidine kinase [Actinobacteria bacterium]|nr:HAMP domain-containing histidine kinase [Actinomycetota bacterium]